MSVTEIFVKIGGMFSGIMTKMVIALVILLIGLIIGKIVGRIMHRVLREIGLNEIVKNAAKIKLDLEEAFSLFVTYFIYFVTVVTALRQMGLATIILDIISIMIIVIIVVAVFLGIKDFIPNMMSGVFIHQKKLIKEGDILKIKGVEGKIVYINLVETKVKTKSGDMIHIPNSVLTKEQIIVRERRGN